MVKLNKIYTRTGDDGTTGLAAGPRRSKADLRVEAYGTVDEANSCIGLARLHTQGHAVDPVLARMQNDFFDLGADLATPVADAELGYQALRITQAQVDRVESDIDALNAAMEPLKSFVLPGGSPAAAALHLARTVARRAERHMVALSSDEEVSAQCLRYINRASDLLFVAARAVNNNGHDDVLWVPGQNR